MTIMCDKTLGFREVARLCNFILYMIDHHSEDCIDNVFTYNMYYDEPEILREDLQFPILRASDYDLGFDSSGNCVEL